jgi:transcriptional regulator with XRE-family HTH domain
MTQIELSKKLGLTRSGVNAWEMGISVPSTQYIVELANLFNVSTDYLLGINRTSTIDVSGLTDADIELLQQIINHLKQKRK